jgi:hypothetical protein
MKAAARILLAGAVTVNLWCSYFETNFYYGATKVATEGEWREFFCRYPAQRPPRMLERGWQLTCEVYRYERPGQGDWTITTDSARCFPASVPQPNFWSYGNDYPG